MAARTSSELAPPAAEVLELLVSSAEETAKDVYRVLADIGQLRDPELGPTQHQWMTTGDPAAFETLARRFLGPEVTAVTREAAL